MESTAANGRYDEGVEFAHAGSLQDAPPGADEGVKEPWEFKCMEFGLESTGCSNNGMDTQLRDVKEGAISLFWSSKAQRDIGDDEGFSIRQGV